jgi:hypothetical protein
MVVMAPARAEEEGLVTFKLLNLEAALTLANATLEECRAQGYQVAIKWLSLWLIDLAVPR